MAWSSTTTLHTHAHTHSRESDISTLLAGQFLPARPWWQPRGPTPSLRPRPGPQHYSPPQPLRLVILAAFGGGSAAVGFLPFPLPPGPLRSMCDVTCSTLYPSEALVATTPGYLVWNLNPREVEHVRSLHLFFSDKTVRQCSNK